jgi:diadenosine tetraphosphatase ApaH/serine/threonine PP2A family protein phosphatase
MYECIMNFFDALPLCCILNGKFFCVHGGISPDLRSVQKVLFRWMKLIKLIVSKRSQEAVCFVI